MICHFCQTDLSQILPERGAIPRYASCPKCHRDVKVCLNCRHFDRASYNECRETSAPRVTDKEKANHCDFFQPGSGNQSHKNEDKKVQKDFNQLFKS